jgi:fatty acid desaturase
MNENSKNNYHKFGTSTRYRCIHIQTGAPEIVTKTKAPFITRTEFLSVQTYFTAVISLSLEKANL